MRYVPPPRVTDHRHHDSVRNRPAHPMVDVNEENPAT